MKESNVENIEEIAGQARNDSKNVTDKSNSQVPLVEGFRGAGLREDLRELLPQQPPFVMVDNLLDIDETSITTNLYIKAENIFVENGVLTESGMIENIAQTGAARMGYINKYINQSEVKLGFIGEIKKLTIEKCPSIGDTIETTVEVKNEILSTLLVQTQVKCHGEIIASGNMKIVMTEIGSKA